MKNNAIRQVVLAGLFTALTAAGAFIKLPFFPVPFTLQTLFTAFAGLTLAPRWAMLSQIAYLILGLLGIPVFAIGGSLDYVLRPTFGYLLMLPIGAAMISFMQQHFDARSFLSFFLIVSIGMFAILLGGGFWLHLNLRYIALIDTTLWKTMLSGVILFIPAMILKAVIAAILKREIEKRN